MLYEYECPRCLRRFDAFLPVDLRDTVTCCKIKSVRLLSNFYTNDDLIYQFDAGFFGDTPINIHSRGQYKRLLKEHKMADATLSECMSVKPKKDSDYKPQRKALAERITKKLHQEGLAKYVKPAFLHKFKKTSK